MSSIYLNRAKWVWLMKNKHCQTFPEPFAYNYCKVKSIKKYEKHVWSKNDICELDFAMSLTQWTWEYLCRHRIWLWGPEELESRKKVGQQYHDTVPLIPFQIFVYWALNIIIECTLEHMYTRMYMTHCEEKTQLENWKQWRQYNTSCNFHCRL